MDASLSYPPLFDLDDSFDNSLFQGLNLEESPQLENTDMCHLTDAKSTTKKLFNHHDSTVYSSLAVSSSYLHYLQSDTTTETNNFFYNPPMQEHMVSNELGLDMVDYTYLQPSIDQKEQQQYNWLYDPVDAFIPQQNGLFCDENMMINLPSNDTPFDCIMSDSHVDQNATLEGGMSRDYVSLSDVNAFVAKADSAKHDFCFPSLENNLLLNEFPLPSQRDFLSSSESANEDSEDDFSDNASDEIRWPVMGPISFSTPTNTKKKNRQKVMIKLKKSHSSDTRALPSPYVEWDSISPKPSKSARTKYRKSMSNILVSKKKHNKGRRGSAPNRLNSSVSLISLQSSSSMSSLSNKLQHSMRVSDSFGSLLGEEEHGHLMEEEEEEEDENDEDYHNKTSHADQAPSKKGRNVDKACNHCKRSHLRCDDMRPCRRCVATGKTGCKDVQHKPRGRPKLHKK